MNLKSRAKLASARAGNVIGGGDWPSIVYFQSAARASRNVKKLIIRNRNAIRPWQHVFRAIKWIFTSGQKSWENSSYCVALGTSVQL